MDGAFGYPPQVVAGWTLWQAAMMSHGVDELRGTKRASGPEATLQAKIAKNRKAEKEALRLKSFGDARNAEK